MIKIYITSMDAGDVASKLKGYFLLDDEEFKFNGIAFGRIGGHNINIKLSKKEEARLRKLGYDPEEVIIKVQRMIIEGDIELYKKG